MEKISKRVNAIEEVNNNVKLLTEMVMSHSQGAASSSSEDLMKVRLLQPSHSPLPVCPQPPRNPYLLACSPRNYTSVVSACGPHSSDWPVTQKTMMRP